jgi:CRP-like cAMP-binding protein
MGVASAELAAIPVFSSLSRSELEELAAWFEPKTAREGVRLTGEGDSGYSFFVLAEGDAVVTSNGAEVASLHAGDYFGEVAILGDGRRSATVRTTTPAKLFVLFGTDFRELQRTQPAIADEIEASMRERLARQPL